MGSAGPVTTNEEGSQGLSWTLGGNNGTGVISAEQHRKALPNQKQQQKGGEKKRERKRELFLLGRALGRPAVSPKKKKKGSEIENCGGETAPAGKAKSYRKGVKMQAVRWDQIPN